MKKFFNFLPETGRQAILGWCMYDWANSAFAVVVLTAFFPVLFKLFWDSGAGIALNTARLGMGDSIAGLLVAVLSPFLGAVADAGKAKKAFLVFFMVLGVMMTGGIFFVGAGAWKTALVLFVLANIGFACGNLFYDALLVVVAGNKDMDFISSLGYATGYIGGGLLFGADVLLVLFWQRLGLQSQLQATRIGFAAVAVWWFLFSLPLIFLVREEKGMEALKPVSVIIDGLKRLKATLKKIVKDRLLMLFIIAFWLYMDGVYTVITMSVNFGLSIGITAQTLILTILLVQFVAIPASIGFGYMAKVIGSGRSICIGIALYIVVCMTGFFILRTAPQFITLACLVGMVQGGVQALSRSYFARIIPQEDSAEYFGFLNLISRFSIVLGPALVGSVTMLCRKAGASDMISSRCGMSSITILFICGGALLLFAEKERGRRTAIT